MRTFSRSNLTTFLDTIGKRAYRLKYIVVLISLISGLFVYDACAHDNYTRGIWYDAQISRKFLQPGNSEAAKLYNQGIRRVHIVLSDPFWGDRNWNGPCLVANEQCIEKETQYEFRFDRWPSHDYQDRLKEFIAQLNAPFATIDPSKHIDVVLTIWPEPNMRYMKSLHTLFNFVSANALKISGVELEDEENWKDAYMEGDFDRDLTSAADELFSTISTALPGINIYVTVSPQGFNDQNFSDEIFSGDELLKRANFISMQTYQNTHAKGLDGRLHCEPTKMPPRYSPGPFQEGAIRVMSEIPELKNKPLILGLPAYQMDCPEDIKNIGVAGLLNMFVATKTSICGARNSAVNIVGDSYWSEDNVVSLRNSGNGYAQAFLDSCRIQDIENLCPASTEHYTASDEGIRAELVKVCPNVIEELRTNEKNGHSP